MPRDLPPPASGWRAWRDRLLTDPRFLSFAARFPLTRPVARKRAQALHDLVSGFVHSQTLFACVELGVFEALREGPQDIARLSRLINLAPDRSDRLMRAAMALDLVERTRDGHYALGSLGAAALGAPGVLEMVRHHRLFYADLADPVALLRARKPDTELSRFWSYARGDADPPEAAAYSRLMAVSQAMVAEETLAAVPLSGISRLLDVGGGEGAFALAAAEKHPALNVAVVDLPPVAARAAARFEASPLSARLSAVPAHFLDDSLPPGAEALSLVRVLYDHDDSVVEALLARAYAALPPGGLLILSEPMAGGARPSRAGDAYFGFYTLAMTSGRPRSPAEHADALRKAGFQDIRTHGGGLGFITRVITARRGRDQVSKNSDSHL